MRHAEEIGNKKKRAMDWVAGWMEQNKKKGQKIYKIDHKKEKNSKGKKKKSVYRNDHAVGEGTDY